MKKIYKKVSLFSRLINFSFRFTDAKKNYSSVANVKKFIKKYQKTVNKNNVYKNLGLAEEKIGDISVYSYNGTIEKNTGKILIYVHGGSFVEEAINYQINFAINVALKTQSTLIIPRYKLIPNSNYKTMYNSFNELYKKIINNCDNCNFIGDSSGGGFILAYSMYLRDNNKKLPNNVLMLSPWLDLSMENPALLKAEKSDNMSSIDGNKYCGKLWANELDVKNPLISPIYGDFSKLPKLTIMTGSYDIMQPECVRLANILEKQKIDYNYIEYRCQGHDFGCYPTKEARLLIQDIVSIIDNK